MQRCLVNALGRMLSEPWILQISDGPNIEAPGLVEDLKAARQQTTYEYGR